MNSEDKDFRSRIQEALELISNQEAQRAYQAKAPHIDVASELFNQWEDWYFPNDPQFTREFSDPELSALGRFNDVLESVAANTPRQMPSIYEFMNTEFWQSLSDAAANALRSLERTPASGVTRAV